MLDESDARHLIALERGLGVADPAFVRRFEQAAAALCRPATDLRGPVVVAVDASGSCSTAVRWAAAHAARTGAPLRLVHAFTWRALPDALGLDPCPDRDLTAASAVVEAAAELARALAPHCAVSTVVRAGPRAAALTGACHDAALLVLGAAGSWRRGADAVRLLRRTSCAVAVVGTATTVGASQVVVGVDAAGGGLTAATRTALATAAALADELECERGVRVVAAGLGPAGRTGIATALQAAAPGCRTEVVDARGAVASALLRGRDAAAVVVPRSLLRSPWRGGAGRALLRRAQCPVLLTA